MKRLLLGFIIMATWMVVSCTTTTSTGKDGCYGYWVKNYWGLLRGTIAGHNADYAKPYRQCVDQEKPHLNLEKRPYG